MYWFSVLAQLIIQISFFPQQLSFRVFLNADKYVKYPKHIFRRFHICVRVFPENCFRDFTGLSIRVFHPLPLLILLPRGRP